MRAILLAATLLAAVTTTHAESPNNATLTAAMAAPVTSMDPHFYNAAPNNGVGHAWTRAPGQ